MNFDDDGVEIVKNFISPALIAEIKDELKGSDIKIKSYGLSHAHKKLSSVKQLVESEQLVNLAIKILGSRPSTLRVIYLDKTKKGNWFLPWHQDIRAAINKKDENLKWEGWSYENDINYVQLPREVLEKMVTFRINLDDANEDNACLQVIPGSHIFGVLSNEKMKKVVNTSTLVNCCVKAGDLVLMRPHILHASSKSKNPSSRGVLHIEYCAYPLPKGLHWI